MNNIKLEKTDKTKRSKYREYWLSLIMIPRIASTPYVIGFNELRVCNHPGAFVRGNKAPLKKNVGIIIKLIIVWNPSKLSMMEAIKSPKQSNPRDIKSIIGIIRIICNGDMWTPTIKDSRSNNVPWINAFVAPPNAFPITIDVLEIGETRISFKNPNSRSHMTDIPERIDVKRRVIPTIPGKINSLYPDVITPVLRLIPMPAPNMISHRNGVVMALAKCILSR
ncbi:MAG: hypothetical protein OIN86_05355 [Candidatus Methanoperedens sp.]|nr:hypothetical protein [Candidatus Methanoperedens sp.]